MLVSKESYFKEKKLNDVEHISDSLLYRAYNLYLKDFKKQGFAGHNFTFTGFKKHAYNRDLFINAILHKVRFQKIEKILDNINEED